MAIITTGNNFGATDAVTNTKLNNIANAATFDDPADETSLEKSTSGSDSGKLRIKDAGVTTDKLATSSSKTTGVTFAKMQHISTAKVLGRASASEGDVEEAFDFKDEDNMSSNSATALASQRSIKAYVDASSTDGFTPATVSSGQKSVTLPNGLIMKFGTASSTTDSAQAFDFTDLGHTDFPNECINLTTGGVPSVVSNVTSSGFTINRLDSLSDLTFFWQAIGR